MKLNEAKVIAESIVAQLSPHCERCEIAGSIRRQKPEVKDIEIVVVAKPFDIGLLEEGIATVIKLWPCSTGNLHKGSKYTQRILPEGIKLDLFFADADNWGVVLAHRTGSTNFAKRIMAQGKRLGYTWARNYLFINGKVVPVNDEHTLFEILKMTYTPPYLRK